VLAWTSANSPVPLFCFWAFAVGRERHRRPGARRPQPGREAANWPMPSSRARRPAPLPAPHPRGIPVQQERTGTLAPDGSMPGRTGERVE
jgi:hypothetical protein